MEGDVLEDDGITAAIEELQSRLGDLQNSIDQALQVHTGLGKKMDPRLRESCLLIPTGCRGRVHAT